MVLLHGDGDLGGWGGSSWSVGGFSGSGVVLLHGDPPVTIRHPPVTVRHPPVTHPSPVRHPFVIRFVQPIDISGKEYF